MYNQHHFFHINTQHEEGSTVIPQVPTILTNMAQLISWTLLLECVLLTLVGAEWWSENELLDKESRDLLHDKYIPQPERRDLFVKQAKSVPTLGKRNDFFFAKNLKSVPRIGKRNDFFMKTATKSVPRIGRRDITPAWMDTDGVAAWPWFRDDFGMTMKRNFGNNAFHDEEDLLKHLDLTKEMLEPRIQPIVHEY